METAGQSWVAYVFFALVGGLGLFLYGMRLASSGLKKATGRRMHDAIARLTGNRFSALGVGVGATFLMQSSSALTVMLVGLSNAGLLDLARSIGIILGSTIGTTLTIQLIAFRISDYALLAMGVGAAITLMSRKHSTRYVGQIILGLGMVFYGIKIMSDGVVPLRDHPGTAAAVLGLADYPLVLLAFSTVFTAVIQSSAATISLALSLSAGGALPLTGAIPLILGANIGTTATALFSSLGASVEGKRIARANLFVKLFGVALFYPFIRPFAGFIESMTGGAGPMRAIANAHTLFNAANVLILLPFTPLLVKIVSRWVADRKGSTVRYEPKYLDERMLREPEMALMQAMRETSRMAFLAQRMVRDSRKALLSDNEDVIDMIRRTDEDVDDLQTDISRYVTKISQEALSRDQGERSVGIIFVVNNLENMGDIVVKNLLVLAGKKIERNLTFSTKGQKELEGLYRDVIRVTDQAVDAFLAKNVALAQRIIQKKGKLGRLDVALRRSHIDRLCRGSRKTAETSSIHLDVIANLKRIASYAVDIGYIATGKTR